VWTAIVFLVIPKAVAQHNLHEAHANIL